MSKAITGDTWKKPRKKRKGVHAKCKTSKVKTSKRYKKRYKGQGR